MSNKSRRFPSESSSLQKVVVSSAHWDNLISLLATWIHFIPLQDRLHVQAESFSTANTNSNSDKGQPCLTPRSNLNQVDAYPLLIVHLEMFE